MLFNRFILIGLFILLLGTSLQGTTYQFNGTTDALWTTSTNWSPSYPSTTVGTGDIVNINANCTIPVGITVSISAEMTVSTNRILSVLGAFNITADGSLLVSGSIGTVLSVTGQFNNEGLLEVQNGALLEGKLNSFIENKLTGTMDIATSGLLEITNQASFFSNEGYIKITGMGSQMSLHINGYSSGFLVFENAATGFMYKELTNVGVVEVNAATINFMSNDAAIKNSIFGTVRGRGSINASGFPNAKVYQYGNSIIDPGLDLTEGTLYVENLELSSGKYKCDIFSATNTDVLQTNTVSIVNSGDPNIASKLMVLFYYTPTANTSFNLITSATAIANSFNPSFISVSCGGCSWNLGVDNTTGGRLILNISAVLSSEWVDFKAQNTEGGKNLLTWTTASEINNKGFDIERSTDGNSFHNIGQVKGNNKPSSYQYVDASPFTTSYYRLKQVDYDGTATYSKVISVEQKGKGKGLKVYPTLVSNGFLTVDTDGTSRDNREGGDYAIYNVFGQQVQSGKTTQRLDVSALAKGTYVLKVGTEVAKFVKQ